MHFQWFWAPHIPHSTKEIMKNVRDLGIFNISGLPTFPIPPKKSWKMLGNLSIFNDSGPPTSMHFRWFWVLHIPHSSKEIIKNVRKSMHFPGFWAPHIPGNVGDSVCFAWFWDRQRPFTANQEMHAMLYISHDPGVTGAPPQHCPKRGNVWNSCAFRMILEPPAPNHSSTQTLAWFWNRRNIMISIFFRMVFWRGGRWEVGGWLPQRPPEA